MIEDGKRVRNYSGENMYMSRQTLSWLLKDVTNQFISLIVCYLRNLECGYLTGGYNRMDDMIDDNNNNRSSIECIDNALINIGECIELLLSLSQGYIGDCFKMDTLSKNQLRLIKLLYELGIVYYKNINGPFYIYDLSYIIGIKNIIPSSDLSSINTNHISNTRSNTSTEVIHHPFNAPCLPTAVEASSFTSPSASLRSATGNPVEVISTTPPSLISFLSSPSTSPSSKIIVQSNFKVYLYTASPLQISVLSHLCELQARTPNLVIGVLTRESVQSIFKCGITTNEIIKFLTCKYTNNKVPNNVTTQLYMWESERNRIELTNSILLKHWEQEYLPELFQRTVIWAQSKKYELYHTKWPNNIHSEEFKTWLHNDKYLACIHYAKDEIITQINLIRQQLNQMMNRRERT